MPASLIVALFICRWAGWRLRPPHHRDADRTRRRAGRAPPDHRIVARVPRALVAVEQRARAAGGGVQFVDPIVA